MQKKISPLQNMPYCVPVLLITFNCSGFDNIWQICDIDPSFFRSQLLMLCNPLYIMHYWWPQPMVYSLAVCYTAYGATSVFSLQQ